jgi:hypothetical protein
VRLLSVKGPRLELFNEAEALRLGRSVQQLDRQIASQFYERIALSQNQSRDAGESKELRTDRLSFRTKSSWPTNLNAPAGNWRTEHLSAVLSENRLLLLLKVQRGSCLCERLVKCFIELGVDVSASGHDFLAPCQIFAATL